MACSDGRQPPEETHGWVQKVALYGNQDLSMLSVHLGKVALRI
ncbi:hypothetical protein HMPREF9141_1605 [Prevotella multiformis DSM 16608]|uniref:Uncharacterized protein n=1 Tax=Prevotella multiformis DSM 16608 TaxID=888743 RepID=F0F7N8_9BACT|nr:hypothetical protein HMPREF9141_1605 [Prevotella multiformis DSM 16608]